MTVFYPLRISAIQRHNNNTIEVEFEVEQALQNVFAYQAGQYIVLKTSIQNQEVRRSYSLCSSPLQNKWCIAIKKVHNGLFSTYAFDNFKVGMVIDVLPPNGKFHIPLIATNKKNYVAIAAGSGITPILSILTSVLATEKNSSFTLIYGNKTSSSILFKDALEDLKNKYLHRLNIVHILSKEYTDAAINYGRIDAVKCAILLEKIAPKKVDNFFICGPEEMIITVKDFLQLKGIPEQQIHVELFGVVNKKIEAIVKNIGEEIVTEKSTITIIADGRKFDFLLEKQNILDAALQNGADLPYACKGGVCCTCKAKLLEGEVKMAINYGLEQEEIQNGFILTCQSTPITKNVVVTFDVK